MKTNEVLNVAVVLITLNLLNGGLGAVEVVFPDDMKPETSLKKTQDSHLLEELPISPAPNRQDPAEYQWGAVLAGALR